MRSFPLIALAACSSGPGLLPPTTAAQDCADEVKVTVYADADGDGYGDDAKSQQACAVLEGTVLRR